jgi:epoxyqueuosine reductase
MSRLSRGVSSSLLYPVLIPVADTRNEATAEQLTAAPTGFALAHEADGVGITAMDPLYAFEGYTIDERRVVVLALAHNYERLKEVPSDETNGVGVCDVGDQYAKGTRSSYALVNWIRSQGGSGQVNLTTTRKDIAPTHIRAVAKALALIPPAIASGLGEQIPQDAASTK